MAANPGVKSEKRGVTFDPREEYIIPEDSMSDGGNDEGDNLYTPLPPSSPALKASIRASEKARVKAAKTTPLRKSTRKATPAAKQWGQKDEEPLKTPKGRLQRKATISHPEKEVTETEYEVPPKSAKKQRKKRVIVSPSVPEETFEKEDEGPPKPASKRRRKRATVSLLASEEAPKLDNEKSPPETTRREETKKIPSTEGPRVATFDEESRSSSPFTELHHHGIDESVRIPPSSPEPEEELSFGSLVEENSILRARIRELEDIGVEGIAEENSILRARVTKSKTIDEQFISIASEIGGVAFTSTPESEEQIKSIIHRLSLINHPAAEACTVLLLKLSEIQQDLNETTINERELVLRVRELERSSKAMETVRNSTIEGLRTIVAENTVELNLKTMKIQEHEIHIQKILDFNKSLRDVQEQDANTIKGLTEEVNEYKLRAKYVSGEWPGQKAAKTLGEIILSFDKGLTEAIAPLFAGFDTDITVGMALEDDAAKVAAEKVEAARDEAKARIGRVIIDITSDDEGDPPVVVPPPVAVPPVAVPPVAVPPVAVPPVAVPPPAAVPVAAGPPAGGDDCEEVKKELSNAKELMKKMAEVHLAQMVEYKKTCDDWQADEEAKIAKEKEADNAKIAEMQKAIDELKGLENCDEVKARLKVVEDLLKEANEKLIPERNAKILEQAAEVMALRGKLEATVGLKGPGGPGDPKDPGDLMPLSNELADGDFEKEWESLYKNVMVFCTINYAGGTGAPPYDYGASTRREELLSIYIRDAVLYHTVMQAHINNSNIQCVHDYRTKVAAAIVFRILVEEIFDPIRYLLSVRFQDTRQRWKKKSQLRRAWEAPDLLVGASKAWFQDRESWALRNIKTADNVRIATPIQQPERSFRGRQRVNFNYFKEIESGGDADSRSINIARSKLMMAMFSAVNDKSLNDKSKELRENVSELIRDTLLPFRLPRKKAGPNPGDPEVFDNTTLKTELWHIIKQAFRLALNMRLHSAVIYTENRELLDMIRFNDSYMTDIEQAEGTIQAARIIHDKSVTVTSATRQIMDTDGKVEIIVQPALLRKGEHKDGEYDPNIITVISKAKVFQRTLPKVMLPLDVSID